MKTLVFFLASFFGATLINLITSTTAVNSSQYSRVAILVKKQNAFGCSPDLLSTNFNEERIPLLKGWGRYRMPVTVSNDSAQIYFQQGINMYYGFHIIEALASFEKATTFDPNFAMGYWGKALAYGPNINDLGYAASPEAIRSIQKAKELAATCTPVERALIDAMQRRYSADTSLSREYLNEAYATAMKKAHSDFPNSADATTLYADALMVQHPWDLYDSLYNPKPWTPEIVSVLERLVARFPDNPGANHYYIHAVEGSKHPEKGLQVADRLGGFMPGLAHLVHMPSHIYIRSGYYEKGIKSNEEAVKGYDSYRANFPVVANNTFLYLMHNLHMKTACAIMDGQYTQGLKYANETKNSVDSASLNSGGYFGMYSQYLYVTPLFTQIRFGKWEDILTNSAIAPELVYANAMLNFGKGLAYARRRQIENANIALKKMSDSLSSPQMQDHPAAFNPGVSAVEVGKKILKGVIAEESNDFTQAIKVLKEAVDKEDAMLYNEPKDWSLPARHFLGAVLLKAKQYAEAEKVYRQDLAINPNNGWALTGLAEALMKQGKNKMATKITQQARLAFTRSDVKIKSSAF